jgi:WD40 repeat protein
VSARKTICSFGQGHTKGVYPLVFIPGGDDFVGGGSGEAAINPGDLLITGSADSSARSWSLEVSTRTYLRTFYI